MIGGESGFHGGDRSLDRFVDTTNTPFDGQARATDAREISLAPGIHQIGPLKHVGNKSGETFRSKYPSGQRVDDGPVAFTRLSAVSENCETVMMAGQRATIAASSAGFVSMSSVVRSGQEPV